MSISRLQVFYEERLVGTLAITNHKKIAFEYDDQWIEAGFAISPFSLPLEKKVFIPQKPYFQGLFGVFADSLPDSWGNLLLNRMLVKYGYHKDEINVLDRLAIIGSTGMGALSYRPEIKIGEEQTIEDLDELAAECEKLLNTQYSEKLDGLYRLGGSSGGARPKILTEIDNEPWIIKFPAHVDGRNSGKTEYEYYQKAIQCGIEMSESRLFPSNVCDGYFGTKRFDRVWKNGQRKKIHMISAAALLELDYTQPSLDYHSLMKLTKILTRDNQKEIENMYRRMCFNVFGHNRDDHTKNFSFIYDEEKDIWKLAPAYDMTYSTTYFGEHTTSVDGNGRNPGKKELVTVGTTAGLKKKWCEQIAQEIEGVFTVPMT